MSSSSHSLRKLWTALLRRFFHLNEIETILTATDDRYLDAEGWAAMRGISEDEAHRQLLDGVRLGHLERCFLYEWPDAPTRFVVPESYLGKTVRLADVGFIGEQDTQEVEISPLRVREVFVANAPEPHP